MKFQRDVYKDLSALEKAIGDNTIVPTTMRTVRNFHKGFGVAYYWDGK